MQTEWLGSSTGMPGHSHSTDIVTAYYTTILLVRCFILTIICISIIFYSDPMHPIQPNERHYRNLTRISESDAHCLKTYSQALDSSKHIQTPVAQWVTLSFVETKV